MELENSIAFLYVRNVKLVRTKVQKEWSAKTAKTACKSL
jgi:hypothetical protein